ncbi:putative aminotransferase class-V [Salmonella phage 40]|nr:putative aminotransferase class-V [Salmonella phage 40]
MLECMVNYYYNKCQVVAIQGNDYEDRIKQAEAAVRKLLNLKGE